MQHEKARTRAEHRLESVQNPCSPCGREINFDLVSSLLTYDPEKGTLTWKERSGDLMPRRRSCATWNTRYAGKPAFTAKHARGYPRGNILYTGFTAHRIAWLLYTGEWPIGEIDHINGDPADYRICNLRVVSHSENTKNQGRRRKRKETHPGVRWIEAKKRWRAEIGVNRKNVYIGYYLDEASATKARRAAEKKFGFHPNHGMRQSPAL